MKAVMITRSEKRRAVIVDLLISIGIPILQIIARKYCQTFAVSQSFMLMRYRLRYFWTSLQLIRGFRPGARHGANATNLLPLLRMAPGHRLRISRLLW